MLQVDPSFGPTLRGWTANFEIEVTDSRVTPEVLQSLLGWAGLVNALQDWHPAYGRFALVNLEESEPPLPSWACIPALGL